LEFAVTDVFGEGERFPWGACVRELKVVEKECGVGKEGEEKLAL
jgi:hypothetical protein